MNDESIRKSLETIARNNVPENTNLWPRLSARLERKGTLPMNLKWKLVWTILLVLLGLSALTGVAYAVYHYYNDAGLQSVSDAGLVSTLNATAQPAILPTATPPAPVTTIGDSQTLEGVSLSLEWIYLMDGQQAFGFSAAGLADGKTLGLPKMGFGALVPQQYRGASLVVKDDTQPLTGVYVINQVVRDANASGQTDSHADVSIAIPLLDGNGQTLNTFHFKIKNELLHAGPSTGGSAYETRANNLAMRLDWVIFTSKTVQAHLCFTPPDGKDWSLVAPTLQLAADPNQIASTTPLTAGPSTAIAAENGLRCQQVNFLAQAAGAQALYLTVNKLATSSGETLTGDWAFDWNQLPGRMQFPGIAPLEAPLGSQGVGSDTLVTLEKTYADVNRMFFVVFIQSKQAGLVTSSATLKDNHGIELNTGLGITAQPDDPTRFIIELFPDSSFSAGSFKGTLAVQIGTHYGPDAGQAEAHFAVDLTVYPAVVIDVMQTVTANGVEMLLQKIEAAPSFTQAYLCFQKPSPADWNIGTSVTMKVGDDSAQSSTTALLFDSQAGFPVPPGWSAPVQTGRCVKVGFPVGHHNRPETLKLTIPELEQFMPDAIPNDQLQAVRQKLLAQGIDMDWVTTSGNGGGGAGPEIKKKPAGMTDAQVMRLFFEELGYYQPGPWVFTAEIKP